MSFQDQRQVRRSACCQLTGKYPVRSPYPRFRKSRSGRRIRCREERLRVSSAHETAIQRACTRSPPVSSASGVRCQALHRRSSALQELRRSREISDENRFRPNESLSKNREKSGSRVPMKDLQFSCGCGKRKQCPELRSLRPHRSLNSRQVASPPGTPHQTNADFVPNPAFPWSIEHGIFRTRRCRNTAHRSQHLLCAQRPKDSRQRWPKSQRSCHLLEILQNTLKTDSFLP